METKIKQRKKRHVRGRAKIAGSSKLPRLSVFKSNRHIYAQLIDDEKGNTLAMSSDVVLKENKKLTKKEIAERIGKDIAIRAKEKKIQKVLFDKGGFAYAGRVKALAEGARKEGLGF